VTQKQEQYGTHMGDGKTSPKLWATVTLLVALLGCIGTVGAAFVGVLPDLLGNADTTSDEPAALPVSDGDSTPAPASSVLPDDASDPQGRASSNNTVQILSGIWQVSHVGRVGSETWDIEASDSSLSIVEFNQAVEGMELPGDYRNDLEVSDVVLNGDSIAFTTHPDASITTSYVLTILSNDRIEGSYERVDTALRDGGFAQGEAGVVRESGDVVMIKHSP
jgi:hypothetical protein